MILNQDQFVVFGGTSNHPFNTKVLTLTNSQTGSDLRFSHGEYSYFADGESGFAPSESWRKAWACFYCQRR